MAPSEHDSTWSALPAAIWEVDFAEALEWVRSKNCADVRALKLLIRSDPRVLRECLSRTRIVRATGGAMALVGAPDLEACLSGAHRVLTAESRTDYLRVLLALLRGEEELKMETSMVRFDGDPLDTRVHWKFINNGNAGPDRAFAYASDIADERNLHQRLLLADRMSTLGTLMASVSHDIRNPLTFVSHHVQEILNDAVLPREAEAKLAEAQMGIERIRRLVADLGEFSGRRDDDIGPIDLHDALDFSLRMAHPEYQHKARIIRDYRASCPFVRAPRTRIEQVFLNLLVNAAQAIPSGDIERHSICVRTTTDEHGSTVVEIQDTGAGIPQEMQGRVFDPFVTTKPTGRGTGLGLSICKRIAEGLDGTIQLESQTGEGTTVRVSLPETAPVARRTPTQPPVITGIRTLIRPLHILIVDDEPVIGRLLQKALQDHHVTCVTSGREAIAQLSQTKFDVILCDLIMPDMTGMDVYRAAQLRAEPLHDRIVFMTGGAFTRRAREFLNRVPNLRIEKPFELRQIEELVTEAAAKLDTKCESAGLDQPDPYELLAGAKL